MEGYQLRGVRGYGGKGIGIKKHNGERKMAAR